ncbi:MAG: related to iron-sulfur flavoprotein of Methanosarcina thermophila [Olavius algarvensis Delta 4 endosymbiont]|nr:MAG: related to iron-sulfur flavoprotein of Methanosarcina thermophila [Olavius algarvensis Delta 4 endosymbiont]
MAATVLGISGSPVKNSNTDRLVNAILEATGQETKFVKLSRINVRPCFACKQCVSDNICKVPDDFQALAEKIKAARAMVIGAYPPYGQIDGFTKALLERFWSFRHVNNLLKGKLCATVMTGIDPRAMDAINQALATEMRDYENMELVGQLSVQGNLPCLTCGEGDECEMSGLQLMYGPDAKTADIGYSRVEDQAQVWNEAARLGSLIGDRLQRQP